MRSSALCVELDALGGAGKNHAVFADDSCRRARAANPISPALRAPVWPSRLLTEFLVELDATAFRRRTTEQQCRAGRRIDFLVVMHFQDFDVERIIERLGHALGERREQIDAEAHIAGLDDHRALGGVLDFGFVGRA